MELKRGQKIMTINLGDSTKWFRGCDTKEEIESQFEQHKNACRWEVLTVKDMQAVKVEYNALLKILLKKK